MDRKKVENFIASVQHTRGGATINFFSRVTSTMYKVCLEPIQVKIQAFSIDLQNHILTK